MVYIIDAGTVHMARDPDLSLVEAICYHPKVKKMTFVWAQNWGEARIKGIEIMTQEIYTNSKYCIGNIYSVEAMMGYYDRLFKKLVLDCINKSNGRIGKASKLFGVNRKTFYRWMKRYNIKTRRQKNEETIFVGYDVADGRDTSVGVVYTKPNTPANTAGRVG